VPITVKLDADLRSLQQGMAQAPPVVNRATSAIAQDMTRMARATAASAQQMQGALRTAGVSTERLASQTKASATTITAAYGTITRGLAAVTGALAAVGISASFAALAREAVNTAASFEQLNTQLRFVVGTVEAFNQSKQFIIDFAARAPVSLNDVTQAFIQMAQRGLDAQRIVEAIGNAASLQQNPAASFEALARAIRQVSDLNKLTQEELNQLADAGGASVARVLQVLGDMGVKVSGDIGAAGISARTGIEAVLRVLEEDFKNAMDATQGNWVILMSNMRDTWAVLQDTIVKGPLFDFLRSLALLLQNEMQRAIQENQALFQSWGQSAVNAIKAVVEWVARLMDALAKLDQAFDFIKRKTAEINSAISNYATSRLSEAIDLVRQGLQAGMAPESTVDALNRASEAVKNYGQAAQEGTGLAQQSFDALGTSLEGEYVESVRRAFAQADALLAKSNADRDKILAENEKNVATRLERIKVLADRPSTVGAEKAAKDAAKAASDAANVIAEQQRALEASLDASLQRQTQLTQIAADERRVILDAELAERLAKDPAAWEAIALEMKARRAAILLEEARQIEMIEIGMQERILQAALARFDAEIQAAAGKPAQIAKYEAEKVKAVEDANAAIEQSHAKRAQVEQQLSNDTLEIRLKAAEDEQRKIEKANEEATRKAEHELDRQREAWETFGEDVQRSLGRTVFDFLDGQIKSMADLWDRALTFMLESLSQFIAAVATQQIILPVAMSLVGSLGGTLGGGGTGGILDLLGLAGVARQVTGLFGAGSPISSALDYLTGSVLSVASTIDNFVTSGINSFVHGTDLMTESAVLASAQMDAAMMGAAAPTAFNSLGVAGGLAAVGGGIYGALNANNTASMAVYAASAAAGAVYAAGASGLLAAAGATAATTGWTGFGLIAAAVLGAIGLILDQVISPAGPSLAVGDFKGLGIGTAGGQLTVTGGVSAELQKSEGVGEEAAMQVQSGLEASLMQTAQAMVNAINAIAVDPTALAQSTEDSLNRAFADLPTLNSANAEKMEEDIKAQMAFLTARLAAELLLPLSEAFTQVSNLSLDEQIKKLPAAAQGMVQMLEGMNQALNELQTVENADVRGRIHELESRIADFRSRLINDTLHAMQRAFSGGQSNFEKALALAIAIPQGVVALHQPLAEVQAMAKAFAPVVSQTTADIHAIELQLTPFPDLIGDIAARMHEVRAEIAAAGDDVATAIPLFEQLRVAILAQATAATDVANQLIAVNSILLDQMNPVDQAAAIQAQLTPLTAAIEAGTATQAQIDQAVGLSQELLALGESTDNLALQQEAIASLEATQALLEEQLLGLTGTTDPQLALVSIQTQALDALKLLNEQMYALFLSSTSIEQALGVITPTTAQTGGVLTMASGGRVPAMLEPGEAVFTPPMTRAQSGALMALNSAYPRFAFGGIVPGSGDGDTVPAFLPAGSVVLNRNATGAIQGRGFQSGGRVQDASPFGGGPVHITVDLRGAVFRDKRQRQEVIAEIQDAMKALTNPGQLFRPR
jgi:hypothetical protein